MVEKKEKKIKRLNKSSLNLILFFSGLLIAVIGTVLVSLEKTSPMINQIIVGVLILLGIILGVINITSKETVTFLLSTIVFVMLGGPFLGLIGQTFIQSQLLVNFYTFIVAFIIPSAFVVALRAIYNTSKDE
jgi:hypothetical protein